MSWDGIVIKKSFLCVSVYSDRVLQLFLSILVPQLQVLVNNGFYPEHSMYHCLIINGFGNTQPYA